MYHELVKKIENSEVSYDFRNVGVDQEQIAKIGIHQWIDEMWDRNFDYFSDQERFTKVWEIKNFLNCDESFAQKLACGVFDDTYPQKHENWVKQVLSGETLKVAASLHSPYDCMNSFHFEASGGLYCDETYLRHAILALGLNPQDVKKALEPYADCKGSWKGYKHKKSYVEVSEFVEELINVSCPVNLLTIFFEVDAYELYEDGLPSVATKGSEVGFFSSSHGGGGLIEMELKEAFKFNKDWSLELDGSCGYSYSEAYG